MTLSSNRIHPFPLFLAPCVGYFKSLMNSDEILINDTEIYLKQSPRNHFEILTSQGTMKITFPVKKAVQGTPLNLIQIDKEQKWIRNHWRSIATAYGKAPFFHDYSGFYEEMFINPPDLLMELSLNFLKITLRLLNVRKELSLLSSVDMADLDLNQNLNLAEDFCKPGDELSYNQLFGNEFVKGLSIIDLLFNHGPESVLYLKTN